jgi:hypothetical protein
MTPVELSRAIRYKKKHEAEVLMSSLKVIQRSIFEASRVTQLFIHNMAPTKKKYRNAEELYVFSWEKAESTQIPQEELSKKLLLWAESHNDRIKKSKKK